MGRTFDTLSQSRVKRERGEFPREPQYNEREQELASIPDTPVLQTPVPVFESVIEDDDNVPFIEVGAPRLKPTPVPETVIKPAPTPPVPPPPPEPKIPSVAFFPLEATPGFDTPLAFNVDRELVAFHQPEHPISDQYRKLMASVVSQHESTKSVMLIFTSVAAEKETAAVALNLAITQARADQKRILVVEANHENPSIAARLGIASLPGLRELLNRSVPLSLGLHRTAQPQLLALPPGDSNLPVSSDAEARLPELLGRLRQRFDFLIVNAPAWGEGIAEQWAALADGVYLIVHHQHWDRAEVEAAHDGILATGGKLKGYVTLR